MTFRKILSILFLLFFVTSCITKIESINNMGQVVISIKREESINSNLSKALHPNTDYIIVKLTNKGDGRVFEGRSKNTGSSFEIRIDSVPYGDYTIAIISYDISNTILARIDDDYSVGAEVIVYDGVFGKPKKFDDLPIEPANNSIVTNQLVLSFYSIKSNYENDPFYDNMDYSIYIGDTEVLDESHKVNILKTSSVEKELIEYFEIDFLEYSLTFIPGKKYYWKVIGTNSIGSVESNTWSFIYNNFIGKLNTFKESTFIPLNESVFLLSDEIINFEFESIVSIDDGGDNKYNLVDYEILLGSDLNNLTISIGTLNSTAANQLLQLTYPISETLNIGINYWKVVAKNGYDTIESSIFYFDYINSQ